MSTYIGSMVGVRFQGSMLGIAFSSKPSTKLNQEGFTVDDEEDAAGILDSSIMCKHFVKNSTTICSICFAGSAIVAAAGFEPATSRKEQKRFKKNPNPYGCRISTDSATDGTTNAAITCSMSALRPTLQESNLQPVTTEKINKRREPIPTHSLRKLIFPQLSSVRSW
jgi:hypothetical protein